MLPQHLVRAPAIDSVQMAVFARRFESIVGKMHNTLLRTARSGVINTARDFSCCILTADCRLLAIGESLPIHAMLGTDVMAGTMKNFHPDLRCGDAFLHNSPYHGNTHAADLAVLVPVIDEDGVHRFTVLAKAHQADIGNSIPTTYMATARDVYEEGALIFPAVKVQSNYRDIDDIVRLCMMRIRVPRQWRGDYLAGLGSARIGEREIKALAAEVGWDTLEAHVEAWLDYSERQMVAAIRRLPSGTATGRCVHDPFPGSPPEGIPVQATVTVDSDEAMIDIDLRDNIDCLPCGLNLSEACASTAAMVGVFNSIDASDVPTNAGSFRRVRVHLRENCVVGIPHHPTSCSVATTNVADRLIGASQIALAALAEGIGMAEFGSVQTAAQSVISGNDPRPGRGPFVNQLILCDTLGAASACEDGWLLVLDATAAGLCNCDCIEVDELCYPVRITERSLAIDSEGAGRFRGAPSSRVEIAPVGCSIRALYLSDGTVYPPQGVRGGLPGAPARNFKRTKTGERVPADGWGDLVLEVGESVIGVSPGGGGYGPPTERDPQRVKHDVDEGYVSSQRATAVYGVVFSEDGEVDAAATKHKRRTHTAAVLAGQRERPRKGDLTEVAALRPLIDNGTRVRSGPQRQDLNGSRPKRRKHR